MSASAHQQNDATSARHGSPWLEAEQRQLYEAFLAGQSVASLCQQHERERGGIISALKKLGLLDRNQVPINPPPPFTPIAQKKVSKKPGKKALKAPATAKPPENKPPTKPLARYQASNIADESYLEPHFEIMPQLKALLSAQHHVLLTGPAGTGKTTLLKQFCHACELQEGQKPVVLAPTGLAALQARGQTIHRFFGFYAHITVEKILQREFVPRQRDVFKKMRRLVIDEVSMLRADLLDCIDAVLRLYGPQRGRPFGGVQLLLVGDLYQLPPVVTRDEEALFRTHYATPYFFSAKVWPQTDLRLLQLNEVYRQRDPQFIELLQALRARHLTEAQLVMLNQRVRPRGERIPTDGLVLTATNALADQINGERLAALPGAMFVSEAGIGGTVTKEYYPTSDSLMLKAGAQIMLLVNDPEGRWVNGSLGVVIGQDEDEAGDTVLRIKLAENGAVVEVPRYNWELFRTILQDDQLVSEPVGHFSQFPLRLAWAVTIHKSQGQSFKRAHVDLGYGAFAAGQVYVALSRCTSMAGLTLERPIRARDLPAYPEILAFLHEIPPLEQGPE